MKYLLSVSVGFLFLITSSELSAQEGPHQRPMFPDGISLGYGVGSYAVRDEYISKERYSGTLPYFSLNWARSHDGYVYDLSMQFRSSSDIRNNNVSADNYLFALNQGFLYSLRPISLFSRDVHAFVGPTTELYFFYNRQNIAVSGFDYAQSFALLLSLGARSEVILPIRQGLQAEASLAFSLLSLGFRMVDSEEEDVSPVKLLTLFSGANVSAGLGARYLLTSGLSVKLAYRFHMTRISSWDPLLSASDNAVVTLTYGW
jgi:hypothetical protein